MRNVEKKRGNRDNSNVFDMSSWVNVGDIYSHRETESETEQRRTEFSLRYI